MELGRRLAVRRRNVGITQVEVAHALAVSRASIANIEAGRQKLYVHQLYDLARILKCRDLREILPTSVPGVEQEPLLAESEELSAVQRAQIESLVRRAFATAKPKSQKR